MQILYDMVSARAEKTFIYEISAKNWDIWWDHWLRTAYDVMEEFQCVGLVKTAKYVQSMIDEQKSLVESLEDT